MNINLEDIKPFDLGGMFPNDFIERKVCDILKCKTYHWFLFVAPVRDEKTGEIIDWMISESIDKGVSLDRLDNQSALVYRIKGLKDIDPHQICVWHSEHGKLKYSLEQNINTAIWWLARYYFDKTIHIKSHKGINCVNWVDKMAEKAIVTLVPDDQYPIQTFLENSDKLNLIGQIN